MREYDFTSFDGTRLRVYEEGNGPTRVMVLNGLGGSTHSWERVWAELADGCTFTAWDYRGLFGSGAPDTPDAITVTHSARDLLALMDHLGLDRAPLLSWSYGAEVAVEAWRLAPERVSGIFFLNPVFAKPLERLGPRLLTKLVLRAYRTVMSMGEPVARRIVAKDVALWLAKMVGVLGPVERDLFVRVATHFVSQDHAMYVRLMDAANEYDGTPVLPTITVPVHVVLGARDPFVPLDVARKKAALIPGARIVEIKDASHYTLMEYPEAVARMVREFLESAGAQS